MLNYFKCIYFKYFGFDLESFWLVMFFISQMLKGINEVMWVYLFNVQILVIWGFSMLFYYKMLDYLINRILLIEFR